MDHRNGAFGHLSVHVEPGVYVPRAQSEELARRAARLLPGHGRALDLCTGSGAVAALLKAMVPTATVIGIDVDEGAVRCARRTASQLWWATWMRRCGPGRASIW